MIGEHAHQIAPARPPHAALDHPSEIHVGDQADPDSGADRVDGDRQVVDHQRPLDLDALLAVGAGEAKVLALVRLAEQHEAMLGQLGDVLGTARPAQVAPRREQAQLGPSEAAGDQRRVDQRPGAQRQIEPLRDKVDPPGRQNHIDLHLRVASQEFGEQVGGEAGVVAAGGEPDRAGDLVAEIGDRGAGVRQAVQRRPGPLEVEAPRLGQHQLARAPLQQPHAQRRLQCAHPAADRRLRQPQLPRGGGEAAALHHPHEGGHLVQVEAVRCCHGNNMLSHRYLVV